jgi:hypothetical protein
VPSQVKVPFSHPVGKPRKTRVPPTTYRTGLSPGAGRLEDALDLFFGTAPVYAYTTDIVTPPFEESNNWLFNDTYPEEPGQEGSIQYEFDQAIDQRYGDLHLAAWQWTFTVNVINFPVMLSWQLVDDTATPNDHVTGLAGEQSVYIPVGTFPIMAFCCQQLSLYNAGSARRFRMYGVGIGGTSQVFTTSSTPVGSDASAPRLWAIKNAPIFHWNYSKLDAGVTD